MTGGWRRWSRPLRDIALIAMGLFALSFLPPDRSRAERDQQGVLRLCVADAANPLMTPETGYEYRLAAAIAKELDLRLMIVEASNIGRSFNPRDWRVSRAQCDMLGGGIADTPTNRGFMTLLPNGGHIGLLRVGAKDLPPRGSEIGIFVGASGMDRVRLSRWLREEGLKPVPQRDLQTLEQWVRGGKPAIFSSQEDILTDLPRYDLPKAASDQQDLAFALWRGDVTLTRDVRAALHKALGASAS